jgi:hypothetical protein
MSVNSGQNYIVLGVRLFVPAELCAELSNFSLISVFKKNERG